MIFEIDLTGLVEGHLYWSGHELGGRMYGHFAIGQFAT